MMRVTRGTCVWVGSIVFLAAAPARAQRLSEPSLFAGTTGSGARALGMGGAFIAIADDATAASWNPAGLCVLERAEASIVFQPMAHVKSIYPGADITFDSSSTSTSSTFTSTNTSHELEFDDPYDYTRKGRSLDFASITVPLRLGSLKLVPQVSYQRVVDMGLDYNYRTVYTDNSDTGFTSRNPAGAVLGTSTSKIQGGGSYGGSGEGGGGLDAVAASVGVGVSSKIYLGLALNIWHSGNDSTSSFTTTYRSTNTGTSNGAATSGNSGSDSSSDRTLQENYKATSFQAGILLKPSPKLSLGATFKSGFDLTYDYDFTASTSSVSNSTSGGPTFTSSTTQNTTVTDQATTRTGSIHWPASFGGGIAVMPKEYITFSVDATMTNWSKGRMVVDDSTTTSRSTTSVRTVGTTAPTTTTTPTPASTRTSTIDNAWPVSNRGPIATQPDVLQLRFGTEYVLRNPGLLKMQVLPLRLGIFREGQLVRTPSDGSKVYYTGLAAGLGLTWSRLSVDFAYVYTRGSRDDDNTFTSENTSTPGLVSRSTTVTDYQDNVGFRGSRLFVSSTFRF
jgi:hypothetical protein